MKIFNWFNYFAILLYTEVLRKTKDKADIRRYDVFIKA